jgi:hypothetical protein
MPLHFQMAERRTEGRRRSSLTTKLAWGVVVAFVLACAVVMLGR